MKYLPLSIFSLFIVCSVPAQPCDQQVMEQREHGWAQIPDALTSRADKNGIDKAFVRKLSTIISPMLPKPRGGEGFWYGNYDGKPVKLQYSKPYMANFIFKNYLCVNGKEVLNNGYNASAFINVNGLGDIGGSITLNGKEYSTIRFINTIKNGYPYFSFNRDNNPYSTEMHESWLITYKDKLPFTYMSRKEYLQEAKAEQNKKMEEMIASVKLGHKIRTRTEQEAEKQKQIDYYRIHYKGSALESVLARFEKDYRTDEQKLDDAVELTKKNYGVLFTVISNYLNNSPAEYLEQPAVVLPYGTYSFKNFEANEKDINAVYILRNNPNYYNVKLPVSAPQYITVVIRNLIKIKSADAFAIALKKKELLDNLFATLGK